MQHAFVVISVHFSISCSSYYNKLPFPYGAGMVEALASKTMAWEKERGAEFLYDGVSPVFIS